MPPLFHAWNGQVLVWIYFVLRGYLLFSCYCLTARPVSVPLLFIITYLTIGKRRGGTIDSEEFINYYLKELTPQTARQVVLYEYYSHFTLHEAYTSHS